MFHIKRYTNYYACVPVHAQIDERSGSVDFLQPCTASTRPEFRLVLSLDGHLSQTNTWCALKCHYPSVKCLNRWTLPSRDTNCQMLQEQQQTISTRMFENKRVLSKSREQRPSNNRDFVSSATGEVGRV